MNELQQLDNVTGQKNDKSMSDCRLLFIFWGKCYQIFISLNSSLCLIVVLFLKRFSWEIRIFKLFSSVSVCSIYRYRTYPT
jgi:hypothetical protein